MASSGSVDFGTAISRDNIIQSALEDLGVMAPGDTTSSSSFTDHSSGAATKLNAIVKQLGNPTDGSPGVQFWAHKIAYLFLATGQNTYTLGPTVSNTTTTDKWASSYVSTTISANEASGQTVITVVDNGAISDTNRIGIQLNDGSIQWTVVSGTPTDNGATIDVTIANALTGNANAGNRVFVYATTAQGRRPLEIITAVLRNTDGNDTPMGMMRTWEEYEYGVPNKSDDSTPTRFHYKQTLTSGTIYLDCEPDDVTNVMRITYRSPFEDFDAASDTIDFDPIWVRPLIYSLCVDLCPRFAPQRLQEFMVMREDALKIARNQYPELSDAYFCPGESG